MEKASENMREGEILESKEAEKLSPVFLVYRDNDLFGEYVPKIVETIEALGRKVEIQSFPAGAPKEEIREWWEGNKDRVKDVDIVTDRTTIRACPGEIQNEIRKHKPIKHADYLDELLDVGAQKVILGKELDEVGGEMENIRESYVKIIQKSLENKGNVPEKVYIIPAALTEHRPFTPMKGFDKQKAAEQLKKWLVEAGIPEESIEYLSDADEYVIDDKDQEGNWIIVDRHYRDYVKYTVDSAVELRTPLMNFYEDAKKAGLLEIEPEELEKVIEEKLKGDFSKKLEELEK